ncbi:MAG TPA: 30S ribosomal protein S9 [Candidatus Magasanikbacteria bacterium]|nr:MAG: 30S ribosomal protein S9 [Candidatus Magasanikbacteria bacterium RIFCSPLOWO2_02_FULL_47_16]OGH80066.1 MAG: 30S ribosomal protein S9 [Candidatus Magasanikbacteria bacterium RIFCSPHIGHO2_02_FULL_48_18]OGH82826.1 MAG: 30S ribosomal protein S9 [Candidatus Magasanikbacteria bacterium RIFCSPLOWO2_12_FULL_47_9b]HAZ28452.1 30S ribosomal protein S9 [Candidatus Magasanikbacteria bacterium]
MQNEEKKHNGVSREQTVGRRKTASARVRLVPGKGSIVVNGKGMKDYFPTALLQQKIVAPLKTVGKEMFFDISVKVAGGGTHGQADAVCHGIARALVAWNEEFKPALRVEGFLTRDSRSKERKKPGRYKARRGHQWRKR